MSIDERLDRLTERHEALAQSMELFQKEMEDLKEVVAANAIQTAANTTQVKELATIAGILLEVVQSHQQRIGRLEGQ